MRGARKRRRAATFIGRASWEDGSRSAPWVGRRDWEELPDPIQMAIAPRSVGDEVEGGETSQGSVDRSPGKTDHGCHLLPTVEGGALVVGDEGEEEEYGRRLRPEAREPALVKQTCVEPAEGVPGLTDEVGPGWGRTGIGHAQRFFRFAWRRAA